MISKWNRRYLQVEHSERQPLHLIERIAREYPPGVALDLACGLGRNTLCLAEHGWQVTALDASAVAITRLRETVLARGLLVQPRLQDLEASDFVIETERFDLICDCFYLHRPLIPRIRSGVRAGGLVAFVLPMIDDTPGLKPMNPDFLVEAGEVRSWFEDWEILEYSEKSEAPGRNVAQLFARRPASL